VQTSFKAIAPVMSCAPFAAVAPTPQDHAKAPDSVDQPGWTRQGPWKVPLGTIDRPAIDTLWQQTGCVCKLKEFKKGRGRELMVWGPPDKLSAAHAAAIQWVGYYGDTGGRKEVVLQNQLRAETKAKAALARKHKADEQTEKLAKARAASSWPSSPWQPPAPQTAWNPNAVQWAPQWNPAFGPQALTWTPEAQTWGWPGSDI